MPAFELSRVFVFLVGTGSGISDKRMRTAGLEIRPLLILSGDRGATLMSIPVRRG